MYFDVKNTTMNNIHIFKNERFGEVRVTEVDGQPYFVGRDVATALGYQRPNDAITQHVDDEDTVKCRISDNQGVPHDTILITEAGVYSLVFGSKLETAKAFKRWVCSDVLPAIRKTGGYIATKADDTPEEIMARALLVAQETLKRKEQRLLDAETKIAEDAPKVLFADAVIGSKSTCLIGELAKILTQNGYQIGQNRLFKWMRDNGYLGTKGERYNIPNQQYMEMGIFDVKKTVHDENGVMVTKTTTKVTGKGQSYFINKLIKNIHSTC